MLKDTGKSRWVLKEIVLIKAGFNPVFYIPHDSIIISNFYNAQDALSKSEETIGDLESEVSELEIEQSNDDYSFHDIDTSSIISTTDDMTSYINNALDNLRNTLAFIKTFDESKFDTIYSEREWRSVHPFKFKWSDISTLILPKQGGCYDKFIKSIIGFSLVLISAASRYLTWILEEPYYVVNSPIKSYQY